MDDYLKGESISGNVLDEINRYQIPLDTKVIDSENKPCLYKDLKENEIPNGIWCGELDGKQLYISTFNIEGENGERHITWQKAMSYPLKDGWHIPSKDEIEAMTSIYPKIRRILLKLNPTLPEYYKLWTSTPYAENSTWVYIMHLCGNTYVSDIDYAEHITKAFFAI